MTIFFEPISNSSKLGSFVFFTFSPLSWNKFLSQEVLTGENHDRGKYSFWGPVTLQRVCFNRGGCTMWNQVIWTTSNECSLRGHGCFWVRSQGFHESMHMIRSTQYQKHHRYALRITNMEPEHDNVRIRNHLFHEPPFSDSHSCVWKGSNQHFFLSWSFVWNFISSRINEVCYSLFSRGFAQYHLHRAYDCLGPSRFCWCSKALIPSSSRTRWCSKGHHLNFIRTSGP